MAEEATAWFGRTCWIVLALLCGLPCAACGVLQLPIVRQYQANRLDYVLGEVEPVALAGDNWGTPFLSPDGKWLAWSNTQEGQRGLRMMDTSTYHVYPLPAAVGRAVWVDAHHFMWSTMMVRVPDLTTWSIELIVLDPGVNRLDRLSEAKRIVVLEDYISSGSLLVSTDPATPYKIPVSWTGDDLTRNLAGIPHTIVPRRVWASSLMLHNDRVYSPDGKYFVSGTHVGYKPGDTDIRPRPQQHPLAIYEADTEKAVALAEKTGWTAALFGWAADSSGVYLQFIPRGAGYGGQPAGYPVYKLLVPGHQPSGRRPTLVEGTPVKPPE